ncbi:hypothetical protein DSM104443_00846 [Usitatibacter rugosus]|uniref:Prepilin-type N-terminal cleavage/methylation domain-containing protein n=1 Tax=Usitatibacter rugosus TaxID=2732067 RepID=A0A6M4GRU4_9PROT|nr:prepilin-type N-terminal cleavage/methylation domain-containing protein [Usitatibacter rugosus]QJR09796.1 hypothetical protein DSM104443_00846 [Usitatibacter rugosus]
MARNRHRGFNLVELMAGLVVIAGVIAAAAYYKGRPAADPTKIDTTLPAFISSPASSTNYYLEGSVHRVSRTDNGVYFMVRTPDNKDFWVAAEKTHTGGFANVAAGQVAQMQVQANTGASLQISTRVLPMSQVADAFAYRYLVKTPAPANYKDPLEEHDEPAAHTPADLTPQPRDKDKDDD